MTHVVGTRLQAVNQLGRWELARVVGIGLEQDTYRVRFPGWGCKFDRDVPADQVRLPVEAYRSQEGQNGKLLRYFYIFMSDKCYFFQLEFQDGGAYSAWRV